VNRRQRDRLFLGVSAVVLAAAVAGGFYLLGGPENQRRLAEDRQRMRDLTAICSAMKEIHDRAPEAAIPASLADVKARALRDIAVADPASQAPYEFSVTGKETYRVCAVFSMASEADAEAWTGGNSNWRHPAGRHCFDLNATKGPWDLR
jgi:hypothetical protein